MKMSETNIAVKYIFRDTDKSDNYYTVLWYEVFGKKNAMLYCFLNNYHYGSDTWVFDVPVCGFLLTLDRLIFYTQFIQNFCPNKLNLN